MAQFGARVTYQSAGFLPSDRQTVSWGGVAASPHIYMVTTKADIQNLADGKEVRKGSTHCQPGIWSRPAGGLSAECPPETGRLLGLTRLGKRLDEYAYLHKTTMYGKAASDWE